MTERYGSLAVFLFLVIMTSAISGMINAGEWWYLITGKPNWTPAPWMLGVGWALAYLLMALAAWQVWQTGRDSRMGALAWWGIVLFLTILWHILFLGIHRVGWSWLIGGVLIVAVVLCFRAFRLLSREAALLVLPFLAWFGYLWVLNFVIWSRNGGIFGRLFF